MLRALLAIAILSSTAFAPITVNTTNDLTFDDAASGDANQVIAPASGATIQVTGATPNGRYNLTLSATTVNMVKTPDNIPASAITMSPGTGNNICCFSAAGAITFRLGATRGNIQAADDPGNYTGNATVTVRDRTPGINASDTVALKLRVLKSIAITRTAHLTYGDCAPGDVATPYPAGFSGSGQFLVTGEPNTAFNVVVTPATGSMITGGGGANRTIATSAYTYTPSPAILDASGNRTISIGGTRGALTASQVAGAYTGAITVTVTYL